MPLLYLLFFVSPGQNSQADPLNPALLAKIHGMYPEATMRAVRVYRDLVYAEYGEDRMRLDLYVQKDVKAPVPCIIVIRGGGFRSADKEHFAPTAAALASEGFAAACMAYRGAPDHPFPAAVHDTKAAVRFVRAHADQYHIDGSRIGSLGQSAGGHLAVMLAVTGDIPELEGKGGHFGVSSRIQAAVSFAGVFNFISRLEEGGHQKRMVEKKRETNGLWVGEPFSPNSERWRKASPFFYVSQEDPPTLLVHCKPDRVVPYEQSVEMYEALRRYSDSHELVLFEEGGHGALKNKEAWRRTVGFFSIHLAP